MMIHVYKTVLSLHQTDAAGWLFFASQLEIAHLAYESLLAETGFSVRRILDDLPWALPIVHCEADYKARVKVGDPLSVAVSVEAISDSSFTVAYGITGSDGKSLGTAKTVHVPIDKATGRKIPLPADFRAQLEAYLAG